MGFQSVFKCNKEQNQQNHAISLSVGNSEFDDGYIEWIENQFLVIKSTKEYIRYYIFSWKFGSFGNYEMPPFRLTFANNFSTYGKLVLQFWDVKKRRKYLVKEVAELILFSIPGPSETRTSFNFRFQRDGRIERRKIMCVTINMITFVTKSLGLNAIN